MTACLKKTLYIEKKSIHVIYNSQFLTNFKVKKPKILKIKKKSVRPQYCN